MDGESLVPGVNAQLPVVEHTVVVIALVTIRPQSTVEKIVQEVTPKLRYVTKTHALVSYIIPINHPETLFSLLPTHLYL